VPDFLLPDLGEGLDEAEIIAWRVQAGDHVTVDQVIAEVETAKAVVELPVPYAGVVTALHAEPGSAVSVGQPLITVTADDPAAGFGEPGVVVPGKPRRGRRGRGRGGQRQRPLVGYGTTATARRPRSPRRAAARAAASARRYRPAMPAAPPPADARPPPGPPRRVAVISPLVSKARDCPSTQTSLSERARGGVVSRQDVRRGHRRARRAVRPRCPPPLTLKHRGSRPRPTSPSGGGSRSSVLRAAADKLTRSRREIPEATVWVDVDATALVEARRELNTRDPARPVSLLALLARFAVLGLRRYPELNARVERDEIVMPGRVHLGFAAQTEHGLVVPVVHDAHLLSTRDLSARLAERTAAARERRLSPADLRGGTFTVNNYGVFGVDGSAAIINHPEVAILGMGRVIDRPWVVDGQLAVRKVTELTLAFDHRVCDGGTAGGFLRYVADCVESPVAAMGDM
jgi:pyruvate dehydrogenase E2 component (dihydrolipoamide acetyltransferase)